MAERAVSEIRLSSTPRSVDRFGPPLASPDGAVLLLVGWSASFDGLGRTAGLADVAVGAAVLGAELALGPLGREVATSVSTYDAKTGKFLGSYPPDGPVAKIFGTFPTTDERHTHMYARWFSESDRFVVDVGDRAFAIFSRECVPIETLERDGLVVPIANGKRVYANGGVVRNDDAREAARFDAIEFSADGAFAVAAARGEWLVVRTDDWKVERRLPRTPGSAYAYCSNGGETVVERGGGITTIFAGDATFGPLTQFGSFTLSADGSRGLLSRPSPVLFFGLWGVRDAFVLWNVRRDRIERVISGLDAPEFSRDGRSILDAARRPSPLESGLDRRDVVRVYDARLDCEVAADAVDDLIASRTGRDIPTELGLSIFSFASDDVACRAKYASAIRDPAVGSPPAASTSLASTARTGCVVS